MKKIRGQNSFSQIAAKLSTTAALGSRKDGVFGSTAIASGISFGKPSNTTASSQTGSTTKTSLASLASKALTGSLSSAVSDYAGVSLGLGPLISSIAGLFGGSKTKDLPALSLFELPQSLYKTVYQQSSGPTTSASASPAIHVHVQAMDSQSFVNRSGDIARAVKTAMLNSHSLNDVISEF